MHIEEVSISNYRAIKSGAFETTSFNCIIGENNAGKSTILLALSLFFSGRTLSNSDFYDAQEEITINITFSNIEVGDINRLADEHKSRINKIIYDGKLYLSRIYSTDGKSKLKCYKLLPIDGRFIPKNIETLLKGKKGAEIPNSLNQVFPEYVELLKGCKTQTEAREKLDQIIETFNRDSLDFSLEDLPSGWEESIKGILPEVVYITAVKDFKDEIKTSETTSFGKLLSILLSVIESSGQLNTISESFDLLHQILNKQTTEVATATRNGRIEKIEEIENQVQSYLQESFPSSQVEIFIPKPDLKQIFSNAKIFIDDGIKDTIETKGDGMKRAATFALLRTFVTQKTLSVDEPQGDTNAKPYLFLFEEPELYLHPTAQKILFEALEKLSQINNQVFVTTHSPIFFSPDSTGTFIKVKKEKDQNSEKPYSKFFSINFLRNATAKDAFQILCYENCSAAFFSNKVLLVEGDSDLIYIKEVAKLYNPLWSFDNKNISVISINGKSNVKRFVDFYNSFDIIPFVLVDSDALIDGFEKLSVTESQILNLRSKLLQELDRIATEKSGQITLSPKKVKAIQKKLSSQDWFKKIKELNDKIVSKKIITEEDIDGLELLFGEEINYRRQKTFIDTSLNIEGKFELLELLREKNIFILSSGAIESYYPSDASGSDKPSKALNAIKLLKEDPSKFNQLPKVEISKENYEKEEKCELEVIFETIFNKT